jgi:serine protease Do
MAKQGYLLLGAGGVVGALAMATVINTPAVRTATAQFQPVQARPIAEMDGENLATLRALDKSFANLAEYIAPATVLVRSESTARRTDLMGQRMPQMGGSGSGVIFRPDGWIITNDHVVNGFDKVTVVLSDGRELPGKVTRAEDSDIAIIKVEAKDLPTVQFADSEKVRPGQFAIAVGSPFGLENTVTIGHVSAIGRPSTVPDERIGGIRHYAGLIQTDAAINMGNSGGPLLNIEGQVIGINTAIYSGTGTNVGIGFAIPSNQARLIAETLIQKGKIERAYIGLVPETIKQFRQKELGIEGGANVVEIASDGPAAVSGLKAGDIITKVGEQNIRTELDLRNSMLHYSPGQTVEVEYLRGKEKRQAEVKLGTPPKNMTLQRPNPSNQEGQDEDMPDVFRKFNFPEFDFKMPNPRQRDDREDVAPLREGKARLGVSVETVTDTHRKQYHIPANVKGVVVVAVEPGSVADNIGIEPGDVILAIGGKAVTSQVQLREAMADVRWGDSRQFKTARFGPNSRVDQDRTVHFR